jgi:hypothetical protein
VLVLRRRLETSWWSWWVATSLLVGEFQGLPAATRNPITDRRGALHPRQ